MNQSIIQWSQLLKARATYVITASFFAVFVAGCGGDSASDNGQVVNYVELPTEPFNTLYCPDIGIGEESCVLFDPANPYVRSALTNESKWDISEQADTIADPESARKSKFYVWATILAKVPTGENQFYTADSLHRIYNSEGSVLAQEQAKRAYRSVLDNFYLSVTFTGPVGNQTENKLRDWVTDRLVNPSGFPQLYGRQALAIQALDDWGYVYSPETRMISKKTN